MLASKAFCKLCYSLKCFIWCYLRNELQVSWTWFLFPIHEPTLRKLFKMLINHRVNRTTSIFGLGFLWVCFFLWYVKAMRSWPTCLQRVPGGMPYLQSCSVTAGNNTKPFTMSGHIVRLGCVVSGGNLCNSWHLERGWVLIQLWCEQERVWDKCFVSTLLWTRKGLTLLSDYSFLVHFNLVSGFGSGIW